MLLLDFGKNLPMQRLTVGFPTVFTNAHLNVLVGAVNRCFVQFSAFASKVT